MHWLNTVLLFYYCAGCAVQYSGALAEKAQVKKMKLLYRYQERYWSSVWFIDVIHQKTLPCRLSVKENISCLFDGLIVGWKCTVSTWLDLAAFNHVTLGKKSLAAHTVNIIPCLKFYIQAIISIVFFNWTGP